MIGSMMSSPEWHELAESAEKAIEKAVKNIGINSLDDGPLKGVLIDVYLMGLATGVEIRKGKPMGDGSALEPRRG